MPPNRPGASRYFFAVWEITRTSKKGDFQRAGSMIQSPSEETMIQDLQVLGSWESGLDGVLQKLETCDIGTLRL